MTYLDSIIWLCTHILPSAPGIAPGHYIMWLLETVAGAVGCGVGVWLVVAGIINELR